jgi:hypothetical protein
VGERFSVTGRVRAGLAEKLASKRLGRPETDGSRDRRYREVCFFQQAASTQDTLFVDPCE